MPGIGIGIRIGNKVSGGTPIVPLDVPTELTAVGISSSEIRLNWYEGINILDGINIYMSTDGTNFTLEDTVDFGDLTCVIDGLSEGVTYYFKITSYLGLRESEFSDTATSATKVTSLVTGWTFDNIIGADYFAADLAEIAVSPLHTQSCWFYENKTYVTYMASGDDPWIKYYDHSTGLWSAAVKIGTNPLSDDEGHGNPSLLIDSNGYFHIMFGGHNSNIQYSISTNPKDITAWTARTSPASGTYPQLMQFANGTIYMFYRQESSPTQDWGYKTSADGGLTWSAYTIVLEDYAYCKFFQGVNDVVHVGINGNNTTGFDRLNAYYIKLVSGVWKNAADVTLTLPLDLTDSADIIVRNSGTNYIPMTAIGADSSNNPFVFYTESIAANQISTYNYKLAKYIGGSWTIYDMGVATDRFHDYVTAVEVVSTSVINVYLVTSGPIGDAIGGYIQHWASSDGGETWASVEEVLHYQAIHPAIVKNYNTKAKLLIARNAATLGYTQNQGFLWGDEGLLGNIDIPLGARDIKELYPATFKGTPIATLTTGKYGNAVSIVRATSQYVEVADNDVFTFGNGVAPDDPFTITMWCRFTDTVTNQFLFCKGLAAKREYECSISANVLSFNIKIKAGTADLKATIAFTTVNEWKFFAFTYDGSCTKEGVFIFIDGVDSGATQTRTGTYTFMTNSDGKLFIGCYGTPTNYITAYIDEFKIWNKVLSIPEQTLVMNNDPAW